MLCIFTSRNHTRRRRSHRRRLHSLHQCQPVVVGRLETKMLKTNARHLLVIKFKSRNVFSCLRELALFHPLPHKPVSTIGENISLTKNHITSGQRHASHTSGQTCGRA